MKTIKPRAEIAYRKCERRERKNVDYRKVLIEEFNYPNQVVDNMTDEECEGEYEVITTGI